MTLKAASNRDRSEKVKLIIVQLSERMTMDKRMVRDMIADSIKAIVQLLICFIASILMVVLVMYMFYALKPKESYIYTSISDLDSFTGFSYNPVTDSSTFLNVECSSKNVNLKYGEFRFACERAWIDGKEYKDAIFYIEDSNNALSLPNSCVDVTIKGSIPSMTKTWSDYWQVNPIIRADELAKYNNANDNYVVKCNKDKLYIQGLYYSESDFLENQDEEFDEEIDTEKEPDVLDFSMWASVEFIIRTEHGKRIGINSGAETYIKSINGKKKNIQISENSTIEFENISIRPRDYNKYKLEFQIVDGLTYIYNLTDLNIKGIGKTKLSNAGNITEYDNTFQELLIKADGVKSIDKKSGFSSVIRFDDGKATGGFNGQVKEALLFNRSIINNFRDWLFVNTYLAPVSIVSVIITGIMLFMSLFAKKIGGQ